MREEWGYFRAKYKLPTRNKAGRKDKIKMRRHDGSKMAIPIADYSAPVPIYRFKQARALSGFGEKDNARAWTMSILTDSEKEVALQQKYSQWNQQHQFKTQPYEFARLIAKIGYGYATAEVGFGSFDPLVTDIILGKSDDYFYFVGGDYLVGDGDILPPRAGGNHLLDIEIRFVGSGRALVVVGVRLFSASSTPRYHAVVGVVDFGNEEHAHRFEQHRLAGKMKVVPFTGIQAP